MKPRKAVSPAIVTLLLMAVAVGGSVAVWQSMSSQLSLFSKEARLDVVELSLIGIHPSKTFFSATLKNSGTLPMDSISVGFRDDLGAFHFINGTGVVMPGDQWSGDDVFGVSLTPNKRYVVRIYATSGSSEFVMTKTVLADYA